MKTGTIMHPLGQFILDEINKHNISDAEFARQIKVDPATISNWLSENPPATPNYTFLVKLAEGTKVDLCALVALISPELTSVNARTRIISQVIAELTPDEQDRVDDFLLALSLKRKNKPK